MAAEKPYAEIPKQEYDRRNERARELMAKHGIDALLLFCFDNITYYTGYRDPLGTSCNFFRGAIVPRDRKTAFIAPNETYEALMAYSWVEDIRVWWEKGIDQDPVKMMVRTLDELGLANKVIGVETGFGMYMDGATHSEFESIRNALPNVKFVDCSNLIWEQRMIKTPWEIGTIRRLGEIGAKAFEAGLKFAEEGVSEKEILNEILRACISLGTFDTPLKSGIIACAYPPGSRPRWAWRATDYRLKKGDQLHLDMGPYYKNYTLDFQRQAIIGEPSPMVKRLYEQSLVGIEAVENVLRPGVRACDLFETPIKAMKKFNPELPVDVFYKLPTDPNITTTYFFMGHGEGQRNHEPPYLCMEDKTVIQPGMTIAVEVPGLDIPKFRVFGGYIEELYLITEDGYENLTQGCSRELWVK